MRTTSLRAEESGLSAPRGAAALSSCHNPDPSPRDVSLSHDIAAECVCSHPPAATVPGGGETSVDVKVKARNRRWTGGKRTHPFSITASSGGDGGPPTTVNGSFDDSAMPLLPVGGLFAGGAVIAIIVGALLLGGGDDDDPEQSASPAPSQTAIVTATGEPTDAPTASAIAENDFIVAGEWFFSYTVTGNTCSFGLFPGDTADVSLFLQEVTEDDGLLSDGELISVLNADGTLIDTYIFSYPVFEFTAPLIDADFVFHQFTFSGPNTGIAFTEEHYFEQDGTPCVITLEEL